MSINQSPQAGGCPSIRIVEEPGEEPGQEPPEGQPCQGDAECPPGQVCRNGECVSTVAFGLTRKEALAVGGVGAGILGLGAILGRQ